MIQLIFRRHSALVGHAAIVTGVALALVFVLADKPIYAQPPDGGPPPDGMGPPPWMMPWGGGRGPDGGGPSNGGGGWGGRGSRGRSPNGGDAARSGDSGPRWRPSNGPRSPEEINDRVKRVEGLLKMLDTNGNGSIEESEVAGGQRYMIDRMLSRAGVEPKFPLAIDQLLQKVRQGYESQGNPNGGAPPAGQSPAPGASNASGDTAAKSAIPGFGVASGTAAIPGFGPPPAGNGQASAATTALAMNAAVNLPGTVNGFSLTSSAGSGTASASASGSSTPGASASSAKDAERAKYLDFAKSTFKKYDTNGDGALVADEWKAMKKSPAEADRDHDGKITLDEYVRFLMGDTASDPGGSSASRRQSRFLSARERLPAGLPDWFRTKDLDGDGQIEMFEYTDKWTDSRVKEFSKYDLNGDGVITPEEVLTVEPPKK